MSVANASRSIQVITVCLIACSCTGGEQPPSVSKACSDAFAAAASVDEYRDRHEDLFPAYTACSTVEEWKAADALYPNAIGGADPVRYAMNVCAGNQAELREAPICQAVNEPDSSAPPTLSASGSSGLLGVPLPEGAELVQRPPGDPAAGQDPREAYSVSGTAAEIAAFFNRAMPSAGWAKEGTSTETALFFRKGALMIGVLIGSDGGSFTLMGS